MRKLILALALMPSGLHAMAEQLLSTKEKVEKLPQQIERTLIQLQGNQEKVVGIDRDIDSAIVGYEKLGRAMKWALKVTPLKSSLYNTKKVVSQILELQRRTNTSLTKIHTDVPDMVEHLNNTAQALRAQ